MNRARLIVSLVLLITIFSGLLCRPSAYFKIRLMPMDYMQ
jgi:hypothetical protein